jgi:hypothetical protein
MNKMQKENCMATKKKVTTRKRAVTAKKRAVVKKMPRGTASVSAEVKEALIGGCDRPCTKTIEFYTDKSIGANRGISSGRYTNVDGYRYINLFVQFEQKSASEEALNLGVIFGFGAQGEMGSRRYVTLEENVSSPQSPQMITVSGDGCWHGSPHNISSYNIRIPIMGPYVQVFPFNHHNKSRKFSVWAYLVS